VCLSSVYYSPLPEGRVLLSASWIEKREEPVLPPIVEKVEDGDHDDNAFVAGFLIRIRVSPLRSAK
jgi:hypothetical protein